MNPTPLKNKTMVADGIISATTLRIRHSKDYELCKQALNKKYYSASDVDSAVLWLKQVIEATRNDMPTKLFKSTILRVITEDFKDTADETEGQP